METLHPQLPPLIQGLLDPAAYPHPTGPISLIQTHISYILLAGDRAYKLKKPLDLGFLDFSTLDRRAAACHREVELNRRLCPNVYLGVTPVTMVDGRPRLGGAGAPHEWAVVMRRLPADRMLPVLLTNDAVTPADITRVARKLADFHAQAATGGEIDAYGGPAAIRHNTDENFAQLRPFIDVTIPAGQYEHLRAYTDGYLRHHADLFQQRVAAHRVRDCHGDVHAGSICLTDEVLIFDCIEFNDRFRYGDTAAELAFLVMDLDYHGRADLAWYLLEAYRAASGDAGLNALLDFYACYRAVVRGKVESLRSAQPSVAPAERAAAAANARGYFDLAFTYAGGVARPALLITCGLMATGKTTLAGALARRLGLVHLSTDATRKRLAGLRPDEHRYEAYGAGIYGADFTRRTYQTLLTDAYTWLRRGRSVVLDASFMRATDRAQARALASTLDVAFLAVECVCPAAVCQTRIADRQARPGTISDGHWAIFSRQQAEFEPCTELPDAHHLVVDTTAPLEAGIAAVRDRLAAQAAGRAREEVGPVAGPSQRQTGHHGSMETTTSIG